MPLGRHLLPLGLLYNISVIQSLKQDFLFSRRTKLVVKTQELTTLGPKHGQTEKHI